MNDQPRNRMEEERQNCEKIPDMNLPDFSTSLKDEAIEVIKRILAGYDPVTGEELPETSLLLGEYVKQALATAKASLCRDLKRRGLDQIVPRNHGNPWTPEEDTELLRNFEAGLNVKELAARHGRTWLAISARLKLHNENSDQAAPLSPKPLSPRKSPKKAPDRRRWTRTPPRAKRSWT